MSSLINMKQPGAFFSVALLWGGGLRLGMLYNNDFWRNQPGPVGQDVFLLEKRGSLKKNTSEWSAKHLYRSIWVRCFWVEMFSCFNPVRSQNAFLRAFFAQETHDDICFCLHIRIKSKEEVHGLNKICHILLAFCLVSDKEVSVILEQVSCFFPLDKAEGYHTCLFLYK